MCNLHEDVCTLLIASRFSVLRKRNITDECCTEDQNSHFVVNVPLSENRAVHKIVYEIYGTAGQATDDIILSVLSGFGGLEVAC
jgi:hypothetical protein